MFSTLWENLLPISSNLKLLSANLFSLKESKICHSNSNMLMIQSMILQILFHFAKKIDDFKISCEKDCYINEIILRNTAYIGNTRLLEGIIIRRSRSSKVNWFFHLLLTLVTSIRKNSHIK